MLQIVTLEVIGVNVKTDKHYMYFALVIDMLPTLRGSTVISEANRIMTGKEVHPILAPLPTIRSFN